MELIVNGAAEDVPPACSLAEFVAFKNLPAESLVIELNGHIVPQTAWLSTVLVGGDSLELLAFVGGG